jgi:membrane protease YdiL (CAAX protease family)
MQTSDLGSANPRTDWGAVAVFLLIACAWSWPLFWLRDMTDVGFAALPMPHPLKTMLLMWGPGIAALVCFRLFRGRHPRTVTVTGGRPWRALAFYFVPMLGLAFVGVHLPEMGGRVHAFVAVLGVVGLLNTLGEELGWRGFLQDALRALPRPGRYVLIGLLWAGWHFTNLFAHRSGPELWSYLAWYLPMTIGLSALIGEATDRGRAVLIAVTLHAWVNLAWEFPGPGTWGVLAAALPFWSWMLWRWPAPQPVKTPQGASIANPATSA